MKLSDAILLGGTMYPQVTGTIARTIVSTQEVVGVCAIGAGLAAEGLLTRENLLQTYNSLYDIFQKKYPFAYNRIPDIDINDFGLIKYLGGCTSWTLANMIQEMNDFWYMSFVQIAEVVKKLEDRHPEWYEGVVEEKPKEDLVPVSV